MTPTSYHFDYFVEDYLFEDYLKEIGENPSDYQNSDHPTGVLIDRLHVFNDKYYDINIFANPSSQDIVLSSLDEDVKNTCTVTAGTFSDTIPFGVSAPSDYAKFIFPYSCKDAHLAGTQPEPGIAHLEIHTI